MDQRAYPVRVASYYPDLLTVGRNDGSPLYYTEWLRRLFGRENVLHLFPTGDLSKFGTFDLHIWVDHGEDGVGIPYFLCPKPNVYIASDTHLGYDYRLKKAREFDFVFCNQHRAVLNFVRDGIPEDRVRWLPHAFDPVAYSPGVFNRDTMQWMPDAVPLKRYDVCFVGNLNDENRVKHLDVLFKAFPNFYWCTRRFHEAATIFNQSKIVFNISAKRELNMRFFEALGSRAFLLTDRLPPEENVFEEGVHYAGYDDIEEMIEVARYYLARDDEREAIADAGYREAVSKHTYLHRLLAVLDAVGVPYDVDKAKAYLPGVPAEGVGVGVGA